VPGLLGGADVCHAADRYAANNFLKAMRSFERVWKPSASLAPTKKLHTFGPDSAHETDINCPWEGASARRDRPFALFGRMDKSPIGRRVCFVWTDAANGKRDAMNVGNS
jgi:hypothetical protein